MEMVSEQRGRTEARPRGPREGRLSRGTIQGKGPGQSRRSARIPVLSPHWIPCRHRRAFNGNGGFSKRLVGRKSKKTASQIIERRRRGRNVVIPAQQGHGALDSCAFQSGMAEREGFEPSIRFNPYDALAKRCFRPLSHLSGCKVERRSKCGGVGGVNGFSDRS